MLITVHPRLRGELLYADLEKINNIRFIPAYAGNSWNGENGTLAEFGSSPLTRGTRFKTKKQALIERFIPAYAGNS